MKQCLWHSIDINVNPGIFNPAKLPLREIGEKADASYVGGKVNNEDFLTKTFDNENQSTKWFLKKLRTTRLKHCGKINQKQTLGVLNPFNQ